MVQLFRKDPRMTTAAAPSTSISPTVQLTAQQRTCLEQITRRQTSPQRLVRRARIILALAGGASHCHLARQMQLNRGTIRYWHRRWLALTSKLEQLASEGVSDKVLTAVIEEVLTDTRRP